MKFWLKTVLTLQTFVLLHSTCYAEISHYRSIEYLQAINQMESRCSELTQTSGPGTLHSVFCSDYLQGHLLARYCLYYHMKNSSNDLDVKFQAPKYSWQEDKGNLHISMNCQSLPVDDWLEAFLQTLKPDSQ